jgi:hypothetical protein
MPSRSAKDLAAQAWIVPMEWMSAHAILSVLAGLLIASSLWLTLRARRRTGHLSSRRSGARGEATSR